MDTSYYTNGEREFLLKIARQALEKFLLAGEKFEPRTVNKKLWEKRRVAVILEKSGQKIASADNRQAEALILAVRDNVVLAAQKAELKPVNARELDNLNVKLDILS